MRDAEEHFDEMLRRAIEHGPQVVTRDGEELVVLIAPDVYRRLQRDRPDVTA